MDGIETLENVVVIAATNRPDILDPAVLRPGRFDRLIYVPAPDSKTLEQIFKIYAAPMPLDKSVDLQELAKQALGYSGADVEALCREAALNALRKNSEAKEVSMEDFSEAMEKIKSSITPDMETWYQSFLKRIRKEKTSVPMTTMT
jgi:transitional endoplasmic reticulum ATPase